MKIKLGKMFSGFKKGLLLFTVLMLIALPSSVFAGNPKIKTMTRNLYLGADISKVVEAALNPYPNPDGLDIPRAVKTVFEDMQNSNFPERAEALADEIALFEPDVVGLQEVSIYCKQTPATAAPANLETDLEIDFFSVLNDALEARGMYYTAFIKTNADLEIPMLDSNSPTGLSDIRMIDHDIILVREDHDTSNEYKNKYIWQLGLNLGSNEAPIPVEFTRGYISVDVNIKGNDFRFVNTHLEVRSAPGSVCRVFQAAQMQELIFNINALSVHFGSKPIVMIGDFNSSPEDEKGVSDVPGMGLILYVPPYTQAVDAGYLDAWLEQKKYDDGYTFGFDEYISDPTAELTTRIDLIFLDPKDLEIDKVKATVVGNNVEDMTPSGLWPSDHAGVVTKVKFLTP